ncbi:uncharacterized protein VTP21DRAFT_1439 [Calcarisporiella thermophila]|uniref:uncharacterized protein n=1 Tax=Calcarisporiella thermophila TaxID=911321 RepID=UPI0037439E77
MSRDLRKKVAKAASRQRSGQNTPIVLSPNGSRYNSEDEDNWSVYSGDSQDSFVSSVASRADASELEEITTWEDDLKQCVDNLNEKRTSTREEALAKLARILSKKFAGELLSSRRETLLDTLKRGIKKSGSHTENALASKVLLLTFITIGEEDESMFQEVYSLLKYTIVNNPSSSVKCSCIDTLAMACFIAASIEDTIECLGFFFEILKTSSRSINSDESDAALTHAANAYGLLFSIIWGEGRGDESTLQEELKKVMPVQLKLLESSVMETRVAAGLNIALIFESASFHNEDDEDEVEIAGNNTEYDQMDELVELLQQLATDSNRRRSKKDRSHQRSVFRDIVRTVEAGVHPEERLKFRRQTLRLESWAKILQLKSFRSALSGGLQIHFESNELVQGVFQFVPLPPAGSRTSSSTPSNNHEDEGENYQENSVDRRYLNAEMAKERTRERNRQRRGKSGAAYY